MAIDSASLSRCRKQIAGRLPAAQLIRNIPDAVHCSASQSQPNTKIGRRGSSPFQVVIRRPILAAVEFSCGPELLDCLPQSPVVSPCEWLRFSGVADIPNEQTEMEKQGSRGGETDFPTREGLALLKNRNYRLTFQ